MSKKALNFANLPNSVIIAVCDALGGDGHGLYYPQLFREAGLPEEYIQTLTRTHTSDFLDHKTTILNADGPVAEMTSIYSLDVYERIGTDLGLTPPWQTGRGFRARHLDEHIRAHVALRVYPE